MVLFEDQSFDKADLKAASSLALKVSLSEMQSAYRRDGWTSQECFACGRVRIATDHIHYKLDTLNETLRHFDRTDSYNKICFKKVAVAINTAPLLKKVALAFQYANGAQKLFVQDTLDSTLLKYFQDFKSKLMARSAKPIKS